MVMLHYFSQIEEDLQRLKLKALSTRNETKILNALKFSQVDDGKFIENHLGKHPVIFLQFDYIIFTLHIVLVRQLCALWKFVLILLNGMRKLCINFGEIQQNYNLSSINKLILTGSISREINAYWKFEEQEKREREGYPALDFFILRLLDLGYLTI
ncbi:unnamed protein product [Blepharisma stoltei]|uniref:Uncharacterized protein n=1 Tax=Blepharisma stoltei TaxID=1481888 RepID=A0AAU9J4W3_9CILI|nr:unnamed protein product [Blepharisma stoltei]